MSQSKNYSNQITQAIQIFNEMCADHRVKLDFIKDVYETDGAANMDFKLAQLQKIMECVCQQVNPGDAKAYFKQNLKVISESDGTEDILALFKRDSKVIDEFCISYLTFKHSLDFDDNERSTLIKIQNTIAKQIIDFLYSA
ncbi:DUF1951 domain-containing protein [[Mycoplasma] testudinis]|uniref:DUF1951 domain-containing protein n=1 Tax=[Mycoplasma] testudinis TaxID=33924 RepID=UPI0004877C9A|nr:DUF1951 domain-containing protein [[Mycoplasma] testudinis]